MRHAAWIVLAGLVLPAIPALAGNTPLWVINETDQVVTLYLDGTQACALSPSSTELSGNDSCIVKVPDGDHVLAATLADATSYTMSYHAPGSSLHAAIDGDGLHAWTPGS